MLDGISFINTPFDILVLGKPGNGKTTLVKKYVLGDLSSDAYDSSNCIVLKNLSTPPPGSPSSANPQQQISILDSSSTPEAYLTSNLYQIRNARTMLFTYATDCEESFEFLEYTINCIMSLRESLPPCVVACLKSDLSYSSGVLYSQGKELAESVGALGFFEVSSQTDSSVDSAFEPLIAEALKIQASEGELHTTASSQPLNDVFSNSKKNIQSPVTAPLKADSDTSRMPSIDLARDGADAKQFYEEPHHEKMERNKSSSMSSHSGSESPARTLRAERKQVPKLKVTSDDQSSSTSSSKKSANHARASQSKTEPEPKKNRSGCCVIM